MRKNLKTKGIILARRNIGEADRLLTVFSEEFGKIKIVARGSRRIKSKLAPHIEPFCVTKLEFVEGKSFYILTGAERETSKGDFSSIDDYRIISYLYEITDLAFQEREPNKTIFSLLAEITNKRYETEKELAVCRYYELKLLSSIGFRPDFERCKECGEKLPEQPSYSGDFEGLYCTGCSGKGAALSLDALKVLRFMSNRCLDDFLNVKDIQKVVAELEKIITPQLREILPREPKSLQL